MSGRLTFGHHAMHPLCLLCTRRITGDASETRALPGATRAWLPLADDLPSEG